MTLTVEPVKAPRPILCTDYSVKVEYNKEIKKMPRKQQAVSLNIKNPEVHHAAARLAELQGTTITAAVLNAVRAELSRCETHYSKRNEVQRMEEFARRISALPLLDTRSDDEILGYGPEGYLIGG
jgi:antitoxin VapB